MRKRASGQASNRAEVQKMSLDLEGIDEKGSSATLKGLTDFVARSGRICKNFVTKRPKSGHSLVLTPLVAKRNQSPLHEFNGLRVNRSRPKSAQING